MILPRETTSARRIESLIEEVLREEQDRLPIAQARWQHLFDEERDTIVDVPSFKAG